MPELEDEGFTDKVKDLAEELKEKLENNRAAATFMTILRSRSHGTYLELSEAEIKKLEELARIEHPKSNKK